MANSLKDLVTSVDWGKMMSNADVRNALVGSALGGLVLGGTSLMADRDPEESKFAPVGDALLGTLLGGVAGYGIPKGLALFHDAGSLAPDDDRLRHGSSLVPALLGLGGGAAYVLGGTELARRRLLASAKPTDEMRDKRIRRAGQALRRRTEEYNSNPSPAAGTRLRKAKELFAAVRHNTDDYYDLLAGRNQHIIDQVRGRDLLGAWRALKERRRLVRLHNKATTGVSGFLGSIDALPRTRVGELPESAPWYLGERAAKLFRATDEHMAGYARRPIFGSWTPKLFGLNKFKPGPRLRILGRAGKYGAVMAALAALATKWMSPSSQDNFKE